MRRRRVSVSLTNRGGLNNSIIRVELEQNGNKTHIRDVMPPDEYHDHVDDSVYTNVIAAMSLDFATQAAGLLNMEANFRSVQSTTCRRQSGKEFSHQHSYYIQMERSAVKLDDFIRWKSKYPS